MARMIAWNAERVDIATKGSGNPGTMNMIRNFGYKKGIATLVLDGIKGAVPALLGNLLLEYNYPAGAGFNPSLLGVYVGGLAVIIGHMFPIVFKFKGGKGVACAIGVFFVADPLVMLAVFILGFFIFYIFEYGFVASLSCILIISVLQIVQIFTQYRISTFSSEPLTDFIRTSAILTGVIFALIYIAHWKNFKRLFTGKESKISIRTAVKNHRTKKRAEAAGVTDGAVQNPENKEK